MHDIISVEVFDVICISAGVLFHFYNFKNACYLSKITGNHFCCGQLFIVFSIFC